MYLPLTLLISTLAIAASVNIRSNVESKLLKHFEESQKVASKVDKKVEGVTYADGYIVSTYTSGAPSNRIIGQETFTGGIFGPFVATVNGVAGQTIWLRLQFDILASNTYTLSGYGTNPASTPAPVAVASLTSTLDNLASVTSSSNQYGSSYYTYEATGTVVAAGSLTVSTKYFPLTAAPSYPVSIPQIVQTITVFGATFFTAQYSTSVYNFGSGSFQWTTKYPIMTEYPSEAPTKAPGAIPSAQPVTFYPTPTSSPSLIGYNGAIYYLVQYNLPNGGGLTLGQFSMIQLGGPLTYTVNSGTTPAVLLTEVYNTYLNTGSSSSSSSTTCFSGSSEVAMESGANKQISEVAVGDRVLAFSTKTQSAVFSSVVAVPHNKNNKVSEFVQITTESGKVVKMTSQHLIQSCEGLVAASKIASGACVVTVDGQENVSAVEKVVEEGLYTVVTEEELVVVDGVVASPFAVNHFIPNMFYNFHRFAFGLMPSFLSTKMMESVSTVADEVAQYYTVATDSL